MKSKWMGLLAIVGILSSCSSSTDQNENTMVYAKDSHSYSEPNKAVVTHLDLALHVDFDSKTLFGKATWDVDVKQGNQIIFDCKDLTINSVQDQDGKELVFSTGPVDNTLGQPLWITVGDTTTKVTIQYTTSPKAAALQWLNPQQTAGKESPFLFTQSQAILARTWIPTQDSPGIRFTYKAHVKVPSHMMALMSADNPQAKTESGEYHFTMDQAIPSYLMALSVGDVEFQSVGDRTGIYAEPSVLASAVYEFEDMENMVVAAEALYGPYVWGRYDLIVLPPSFPFGGMENPKLTFATPTILAGDRSLVSLVAHELAHSWSGNLVTNATWDDFWLNEGFTVYFEERIMEALYGRDYSEMLASLSLNGLTTEVAEFMETRPKDTHLKLNLEGRNPDDGMNSIAYDKGYYFLRLCEETVGRESWDAFVKGYFTDHSFQVMDTEGFLVLLNEFLTDEQKTAIRVDEWVYGAGIPDNCPTPNPSRFERVQIAIDSYMERGMIPGTAQMDEWSTHEWLRFINGLGDDITVEQLAVLDENFMFTQSGNAEILAAWFQPTIKAGYEPVIPIVEGFLITVGRRKFLTPTYTAMKNAGQLEWAREVYAKARPNYHYVAVETMDALLDYSEEQSTEAIL
ncbi:MAG: M1 family metallopeptidase [Schleiferiaceae bacterium]